MDTEELTGMAEEGDVDAQYMLAVVYYEGRFGTEVNLRQAIACYTKAAEQNDSASQYALAEIYCGQNDMVNARIWAGKAVENGHAITSKCLHDLGFIHP
ncbi:MAG: sel1 repeat family protein [Methyloprofundus sp.]|nr:sel1 repeat family protein [Methyloprofundus sp.]